MGVATEMRDIWIHKRKYFIIPSPAEDRTNLSSKKCSEEGAREGVKAAAVAAVVTAVPTLAAVRYYPWAKANLNYVSQALIISAASVAAYFITADRTITQCARRKAQYEESVSKRTA